MQLKLELQEVVLAKEEQEEVLRRRERELTALKGALKDEVSTHDQEVDKLREQYEKEIRKLQTNVDEAKQVSSYACLIKCLFALLTAYKCRPTQLCTSYKWSNVLLTVYKCGQLKVV